MEKTILSCTHNSTRLRYGRVLNVTVWPYVVRTSEEFEAAELESHSPLLPPIRHNFILSAHSCNLPHFTHTTHSCDLSHLTHTTHSCDLSHLTHTSHLCDLSQHTQPPTDESLKAFSAVLSDSEELVGTVAQLDVLEELLLSRHHR